MISLEALKSDVDENRLLLQDERTARLAVERQLAVVNTQLQQQQQIVIGAPQVQNLLLNSDFSSSWDSFKRAITVADDARFEAYNIYRNTIPVSGQQLLEDSVYSGALVANSKALPDFGRSDAPTLDPDWERGKGYARLGTTSTIDFPLSPALLSLYYPGRSLFCGLIVAKRSANVTIPGGLYAGLWNSAVGFRDWLPASAFAITGTTIGTPGATTSREYLVVGTTDWGRTVSSATVTVANAPANGNFVSGSVYVKLAWAPMAGVIRYDIYRKTGATYDWLASESIANGYFDQGTIKQAGIGGYPSTNGTNAIAYVATADGVLNNTSIDGVSARWQAVDFNINIPSTFNLGNATDKIWLRIGLTQALTGTDAAHGLLVDLAYLSYISGAWAHHPDDDKALQKPVSAPSGSSQGGTGTGGGGFEPPDPGGGGPRCIAEDSRVEASNHSLVAHEAAPGKTVLSPDRNRFFISLIREAERTWAEKTLIITSESGHKIRCSLTEPFKRFIGDRIGAVAITLKVGDPVVVCDEKRETTSRITEIQEAEGCWVVMISLVGRRKFFIAATQDSAPGGYVLHNVKIQEV